MATEAPVIHDFPVSTEHGHPPASGQPSPEFLATHPNQSRTETPEQVANYIAGRA